MTDATARSPEAILDEIARALPRPTAKGLASTVARLIRDGRVRPGDRLIRRAADTYASRRENLAAALGRLGLDIAGGDGVFLWVPVASERAAVAELARHNIGVAVGSACLAGLSAQSHIRVSITLMPDNPDAVEQIARLIAGASKLSDPESSV